MSVVLALTLAPAARGANLYSNLDTGYGGSNAHEVNQSQWMAQPFVPTASGVARLASFWAQSYFQTVATMSISIYTNSNGLPGTRIADGAGGIHDETGTTPTCTALAGVSGQPLPTLTAGTTYWAVMHSVNLPGVWLFSNQGGTAGLYSTNSGGSWNAEAGPFTVRVDDAPTCQPHLVSNPVVGGDLADMYATVGGTSFQTLFISNNGLAALSLTGASFTGPQASMFKVLNGEPNGKPPGTAFKFPKILGTGVGGVFLYIVCAPPEGTQEGMQTATLTLTSNDPGGPISWPVLCIIDTTPPSLEFTQHPDGSDGWWVTQPAALQIRGVDPESGNRVKRIFCSDNGEASLDWRNGSVAQFSFTTEADHALSCQGTDLANNTSAPGGYTTHVKVDLTPPETTKGDGWPGATSPDTGFTLPFIGTDATSGVAGFECRFDSETFTPCTSPVTLTGVHNGAHTFAVRARDTAGLADPSPIEVSWQVDAPAPTVADDTASVVSGADGDIDVLANDTGPGGGTLTVVLADAATAKGGAVSLAGSKVHYVPPPGFVGTDTFSYKVVSDLGVPSGVATVTVQVLAQANSLGGLAAKLTRLVLAPARFRAARGGASVAANTRGRPPVGTRVRYVLDKPSSVTFVVLRALRGRRSGTACVKPTRALRRAKRCTRYVAQKDTFTISGSAGVNTFRFTGRLGTKALRPGRYRLVATPAAIGDASVTSAQAGFRIFR